MTDIDDNTVGEWHMMPATSGSITKIAAAFVKAQAQIGHATKSSNNPHFRSKYADLTTIIETIRPVLADHGLSVWQRPIFCTTGIRTQTVLLHESGEWLADGSLYVPASKQDAQGFGSAQTYDRRYGMVTNMGVGQEDDDGNAASAAPTKPAQAVSSSPAEYVIEFGKKYPGRKLSEVLQIDRQFVEWAAEHGPRDREVFQAALAG